MRRLWYLEVALGCDCISGTVTKRWRSVALCIRGSFEYLICSSCFSGWSEHCTEGASRAEQSQGCGISCLRVCILLLVREDVRTRGENVDKLLYQVFSLRPRSFCLLTCQLETECLPQSTSMTLLCTASSNADCVDSRQTISLHSLARAISSIAKNPDLLFFVKPQAIQVGIHSPHVLLLLHFHLSFSSNQLKEISRLAQWGIQLWFLRF